MNLDRYRAPQQELARKDGDISSATKQIHSSKSEEDERKRMKGVRTDRRLAILADRIDSATPIVLMELLTTPALIHHHVFCLEPFAVSNAFEDDLTPQ